MVSKKIKFKIKFSRWIIFTILFVPLFLLSIITVPFLSKIYPNIYIADHYVGDKTKDKAFEELQDITLNQEIEVGFKNETKKILVSELIENIDYSKSVERAYNLTNSNNFILDIITRIKLIFKPINLGFIVNFNNEKLAETLLIFASEQGEKPISPSAKIVSNQIEVNPGKNGVEIDIIDLSEKIKKNIYYNRKEKIEAIYNESNEALTEEQVLEFKQTATKIIGKSLELKNEFDTIVIDQNTLLSFLSFKNGFSKENIEKEILNIARKVNRNPQDSVFIIENGVVREFAPSKNGITVDEDKLIDEIKKHTKKLLDEDAKSHTFDLPVITSAPKIKTEDVNNLGIDTLLGKGISYYKGSIPNRIHNINLAQSKFKGILVPAGETFSFNSVLGDVSSYTGYKAAYVIKDGKTVLGDGGGVCQVSTTLFRAVLSAGLPVVERRPHSYRVGYYEQGFAPGLDATVFYPTTDFKFKNDTPAYILIQPTNDSANHTLTFEIYGTSDGRVATTTKPVITSSTAPPPDLYVDDPTLPAGTTRQIEHKAYGARVVFDYHVKRGEQVLIDTKFISNYRPWGAVFLRGVAQQ